MLALFSLQIGLVVLETHPAPLPLKETTGGQEIMLGLTMVVEAVVGLLRLGQMEPQLLVVMVVMEPHLQFLAHL